LPNQGCKLCEFALADDEGEKIEKQPKRSALVRILFPAHTAYLTNDPIGGSPNSQIEYANTVNQIRIIGVENGVYLGYPNFRFIDGILTKTIKKIGEIINK
jgi:hypothetical protein